MTGVIGGIAKFLESVDQKAGEYAARQQELDVGTTGGADGGMALAAGGLEPAIAGGGYVDDELVARRDGSGGTTAADDPSRTVFGTARRRHSTPTDARESTPPLQSVDRGAANSEAVSRLQHDYERAVEQLRATTSALAHARDELAAIRGERERLTDDLANVVKQYNTALSTSMRLELDVQNLEVSYQEARQGRDGALQELRAAETQRKQLDAALRSAQQELADFRAKSMILLNERDATITELRGRGGHGDNGTESREQLEAIAALQKRLEISEAEVQRRRDAEFDSAQLLATIDKLRQDLNSSELKADAMARTVDDAKHQTQVAETMYEGEVAAHTATLTALENAIADRDSTIKSLQRAAASAAGGGTGGNTGAGKQGTSGGPVGAGSDGSAHDWERRAKDLAELVMEKQSALEAKRNEADQWRTRCEIAQQRVREIELLSLSAAAAPSSGGASTDGPRGLHRRVDMPSGAAGETTDYDGSFERSRFFGRLAVRGKLGAQLSGVAKGIDDLTLRSGSLLRRNSVLRVALVLYVALLHMWVFVVLSISSVPQAKTS